MTKFYCGVDFGTTFSGFCYGRDDGEAGRTQESWPWTNAAGAVPYCKTPTVVTIKDGSLSAWGWEAIVEHQTAKNKDVKQKKCILVDRFKLFLSPRRSATLASDLSLPASIEPKDLIVFYLRKLSDHAVEHMTSQYGNGVSKSAVQFAVTVPAIWEAAAKQTMIDCSRAAGMGEVSILLEPEAASMYACADKSLPTDGAVVVLADCGGGTADLVTHEVMSGGTQVREVCAGTGDLCGGKHVDLAFLEYLRGRLGPEFAKFEASKPAKATKLVQDWERKKRSFGTMSATQRSGVFLDLPDALTTKLVECGVFEEEEDGEAFEISYDDAAGIFKSVLDKIVKLIEDQIAQARANGTPATHLLLVGGLSGSVHVQSVLKGRFGRQLTVTVPSNPGAAVIEGAFKYMLLDAPQAKASGRTHVVERVSRRSYGFEINTRFDSSKHDPKFKFVHREKGVDYASDVFRLFVAAKEKISASHSVVKSANPMYSDQRSIGFVFYSSPHPNPIHIDAKYRCKKIGKLTVELPTSGDQSASVTMRFQQELIKVTAKTSDGRELKTTLNFEPIASDTGDVEPA